VESYLNGEYFQQEKVLISPNDRGFLMGDGIYEVVRSYQGYMFQIDAHMERLSYGAKALHFNRLRFDEIKEITRELIIRNNLIKKDATVYIQITRGVADRSHLFPSADTPLTIYATAKEFFPKLLDIKKGISAILYPDNRWARCDIKSINLIVNSMAHQHAFDSGAQEAIFIRDGYLTEGAHTNVLMVNNQNIITPPKTNYILEGITRKVVLSLCNTHKIPVEERPISEKELFMADELIIVGTTVEITPVIQLNQQLIKDGKPGPVTIKLQRLFNEFKIPK